MRRVELLCTVALAIASLVPMSATAQRVIADVGFQGPEAARYDEERDEYIVSNLGPTRTENDGFISRVSPDGSVIELKWIAGGSNGVTLLDPLGVYLKGDLLYVADVSAIRMFDRRTGETRGSIEVPRAVRLNDLVVAADGTIYVTDSGADDQPGALYRVSVTGGVTELAARSPELQRPNGIAITRDGSIVHGGLEGATLFFRSPTGALLRQRPLPTGRIDGIVAMPGGDLLVASQLGHNVYRVPAAGGEPTVAASGIEVPAAIGLDTKRKRLLVPQIRAATLTVFDLDR